jgi:acyl carrier protein
VDKAALVRQLIGRVLSAKGDTGGFADEDSFVMSGRLASIDVLDLVVALEQELGFDFAAEGFDANNFDSVRSIVRMLDSAETR